MNPYNTPARLTPIPRQVVSLAKHPMVWVASISLGSLLLRLPFFGSPLMVDESAVAYVAYWWSRGLPLYEQVWVDRPQGVVVAYAIGMGLLGASGESIRLFGAAYGALTNVFVFLIAARLFDRRAGLIATVLHVVLATHPAIEGFNPNTELYMMLPYTISAYLLIRSNPEQDRPTPPLHPTFLVAAGVMAALSALMKQSGVMAIAFGLGYVVCAARARRQPAAIRDVVRGCSLFGSGAVVPLALAAVHGFLTAPHDYPGAVLHWGWTGGSFWAASFWYQLLRLMGALVAIVPPWSFAMVAAAVGALGGLRDRTLWAWLSISFAGTAISGDWYPHYFAQIAPALAILAARGSVAVWKLREVARGAWMNRILAATGGIMVGYAAFPMLWPTPMERLWRAIRVPDYLVAPAISRYITEHTSEADRIYAAFAAPDVVFASRRLSAVKYLFPRPLYFTPGAFDEMLAILSHPTAAPTYVIVDLLPSPELPPDDVRVFSERLHALYQREASFWPKYDLYRRRLSD